MNMKLQVKRLPLGNTTKDGPFYPKLGSDNLGEDGRCFWPTREAAQAAGERWLAMAGGVG